MTEIYPIARVWSGHIPAAEAEGFHRHLLATGVAEVQAVEGNLGAIVLRRAEGGRVRFTLLTVWSDVEAVRRYSGSDINAAKLYPGDDRFGLEPDLRAAQHEILYPAHFHVTSTCTATGSDPVSGPDARELPPPPEEQP